MKHLLTKIIPAMLLVLALNTGCDHISSWINPQPEVVGGYSKQRRISDEELQLFEQATASLQGVEYTPLNVATQIVAGTNYRFLCKARAIDANGKKGKRQYAVIVIHKPLPNQGEARILSIEREKR